MTNFRCFTRTWWRHNPSWPDAKEPCPGKPRYHRKAVFDTEEEARSYCKVWNANHDPGKWSWKCEYESD